MSIPQITYSIAKASELSGVSKNRIRTWCLKGYLPHDQFILVGNRQQRRFTDQDVKLIRSIASLRNQGFELATAALKAVDEIRDDKEKIYNDAK